MIHSTGIVCRVDGPGRIAIPVELRHLLDISTGSDVEIWLLDGAVAISKYTPVCLFCAGSEGLERFKGKWLCAECVEHLIGMGTS